MKNGKAEKRLMNLNSMRHGRRCAVLLIPAFALMAALTVPLSAQTASDSVRPAPAPLPPLNMDTLPTLVLPVVFHLGASTAFKSMSDLQYILAEVQRIYNYAKIQIEPRIVADTLPTDSLDVYYQPRVANSAGTNGISYGRAVREVFVRDTVRLRRVADLRPEKIALPKHLRTDTAAGADSVSITQYQASQARTTAHEVGHQLGLPHRQDTTNLEASGTTGWTLNISEIITMRTQAVNKFKAKFLGDVKR